MILHSPADRQQSLRSVKDELLRRGNEFVALQRLDAVKQAVVPAFSPDDPLRGQDVRITGDFDYDPRQSILKIGLEPTTPPVWRQALGKIGQFSWTGNARPSNVGFADGKAMIPANANSVEQVFGMFKQWVESANRGYKEKLASESRRRERQERERLAQEQKVAEERVRVLERLRRMAQS